MKQRSLVIIALCVVFTSTAVAEIRFESGQVLITGLRAAQVKTADMDGDGYTDIVVANTASKSVTIFYNNGQGRFPQATHIPLPGWANGPFAFDIGDLNNNGIMDMALLTSEVINDPVPFRAMRTVFAFGSEDGSFTFDSRSLSGIPGAVVIFDHNNDGYNDVVAGGKGLIRFTLPIEMVDPGISVYTNTGDGEFDGELYISSEFGEISDLKAVDLNNNGRKDLLAVSQGGILPDLTGLTGANVHFYINQLLGFRPSQGYIPLEYLPSKGAVHDFNGNGLMDFAVTLMGQQSDLINFTGRNASVNFYENDGFDFTHKLTLPLPGVAYALAFEDFDGDGNLDLAVTVERIGTVANRPMLLFYKNHGDFNFELAAEFDVVDLPRYIVTGDFDNDGDMDVAVLSTVTDSVFEIDNPVNGLIQIFENQAVSSVSDWFLR